MLIIDRAGEDLSLRHNREHARPTFHLVARVMHALSKNSLDAEPYRQPIRVTSNTAKLFDRGFLATTFADMRGWMTSMRELHRRTTDVIDMPDDL